MAIKKSIDNINVYYEGNKDIFNVEKIIEKINDPSVIPEKNYQEPVETMDFDVSHIVKSGETLSAIAEKYGMTYQELADYNNILDPNNILVDQIIKIPSTKVENNNTYTVKKGDTLTQIAEKYGITYQELAEYNHISDPNNILVDQVIKIPSNNPENNSYENVAENIKNISEKINGVFNKSTAILTAKISDVYTNHTKMAMDIKKIVESQLEQIIEKEKVLQISNDITKKDITPEQLASEIKSLSKNVVQNINDISKIIVDESNKIKNTNEKVIKNLVQYLKDNLETININPDFNQIEDFLKKSLLKQDSTMANIGENLATNLGLFGSKIPDLIENIKNLIEKQTTSKTIDYIVSSGDTLNAIAQKYGITVDEIVKENNISNPNNINVGQTLKITKKDLNLKKTSKNINLDQIMSNSNIANALTKYADEITSAYKAKIDENEFITINEVEVDGNSCYLTHVIINDPSKIHGEPANGTYANGLEKASNAAQRTKASLMINGSNFLDNGAQDLRNTNQIAIVNGQIVHDGNSLGMEICLDKNGKLFTPSPGTSANELIEKGVVYSFASLDSRLILNGEKDYSSQPSVDSPYNSTVIGMTNPGEYYILTGSTTNGGARDFLYDKGCTYAKSLDQGGSVTLVFDGEVINNPTDSTGERSVGDFLYFA